MQYYVRIGTEAPQVLTPEQIFPLIKEGKVTPQTKACPVGAASWSELGQLVPALFQPDAQPPGEEGGAMEFVGKAGSFIAEHTGEVAGLAKTFLRRIGASNFTVEAALPEERALLEKSAIPIKSPMAQNYAAWRRAMLWFSGLSLALAGLIAFIVEIDDIIEPGLPPSLRFVGIGLQLVNILAPILVILAAVRWTTMRRSRRLARWGWLLQFFGPLLLMLLPMKHLISDQELAVFAVAQEFKTAVKTEEEKIEKATEAERPVLKAKLAKEIQDYHATHEAAAIARYQAPENAKGLATFRNGIAAAMGLMALITLAPRIFGLFPGIVRSSLTLRTLVPESPVPGYMIALIEPIFMVFILLVLVVAAQTANALTFFGLVCILAATINVIREIPKLCKPMDPASMNTHLKPLRLKTALVTLVGLVLLLSGLHEAWKSVGGWTITSVVGHLIGNIFLLTLVASDFFIALMKFTFDQEKALHTGPLYKDMEARFADLAQVRYTQLVDEDPLPAPPAAPAPPTAPGPVA